MPIALPGVSVSTPPAQARAGGLLRVVSGQELDRRDAQSRADEAARRQSALQLHELDLGAYIRNTWMMFRNHRNTNQGADSLNNRLLRAQRMIEGKYDSAKLTEIQKFGGSEVYSRLVSGKCRGATALMRDVYLGPDRPWDIQPQPDPPVPPGVLDHIIQLIQIEAATLAQSGQPAIPEQLHARQMGLLHAAVQAARQQALMQANSTADKIEDMLVEGKFYDSLAEFLTDLPIFPYAVLKGPVVRMVPQIVWNGNAASIRQQARMFWERVSPFDFYWTPGVSRIEDADTLERKRFTRADLNALIGLPGYDEQAVRGAIDDYRRGLREWLDSPDTEQAINEGRENPNLNRSGIIEGLEFNGMIQGDMLLANGADPKTIPDIDRDYNVQCWVVGRYTLKTQINPMPRQRHPYYVTSFEKVPGTVHGHGLPDLLEDIQEISNAALRATVNNLSIASGPQVVIDEEALSPTENGDELYPWKRWRISRDPMGNPSAKPVEFFQPASNVQENLQVLQYANTMADEASAIPRYVTGESLSGGAGRTASGLSMLMNNAQKMLQTVAGNIDRDVMAPLLDGMYDLIMLTDTTGVLTGQESIRVRGVNVAVQRETERQKQLQFLQITGNPIDAQIIGPMGRARVLRAVAANMGLPDDVVPDDQTMQSQLDAQKQMAAAGQALTAAGAGGPPGSAPQAPGGPPSPAQPGGPPGGAPGGPPSPGSTPGGGGVGPSPPGAGGHSLPNPAPQPGPSAHSDHAPPFNAFQQHQGAI